MTDKSSTAKPSKPKLPWMTRLHIAVLSAVTDACSRSNGTVNRRVLSVVDVKTPPNPNAVSGVRTADVTVDPSRDLWIRLFVPVVPAAETKIPILVFFHGGGFAYLSAASAGYDALCRRICRKIPVVIASVNYRLAPEHRCPAPYDDGSDVLRFLDGGGLEAADPAAAGISDPSNCFLAGDSAGGNLAHHVTRRWAAGGPAGWERVRVRGVVAIQPWFGGEERTDAELRLVGAPLVSTARTDWLWRAFLPEGADRDHEAANVFGPRAAEVGEGFPAVAVVVGGFDPLQDWQRRYYEGLRARGVDAKLVEFPEAVHAFYAFPELPDGSKLIDMMKGFVEAHRSTAAAAAAAADE